MSGKRPSGSNNNTLATANGTTAAAKKQPARQQRSQPYVFQAKIQLDDETRSMHMTGQVTYAELQHAVKEKFPGSGPLILKYLDKYVLQHLHNVEMRFYCPQTFLSSDCQCRDEVSDVSGLKRAQNQADTTACSVHHACSSTSALPCAA